jgi:hypothetical protein
MIALFLLACTTEPPGTTVVSGDQVIVGDRRFDGDPRDLGRLRNAQRMLSADLAGVESPLTVDADDDATVGAIALLAEAAGPEVQLQVRLPDRRITVSAMVRADRVRDPDCWQLHVHTGEGAVFAQRSRGEGAAVRSGPFHRLTFADGCALRPESMKLVLAVPGRCPKVALTAAGPFASMAEWLDVVPEGRLHVPSALLVRDEPQRLPGCEDAIAISELSGE